MGTLAQARTATPSRRAGSKRHAATASTAAESSVSVVEDNEIRKVGSELGLDHSEIIGVRSRYRDRLAVLRPSTDTQ